MEHVYLLGAEDVIRAGIAMREAASEMLKAANQIHESISEMARIQQEMLMHTSPKTEDSHDSPNRNT